MARFAGFRPILAGAGKNAADCLMCIDAVELALSGEFNAFALASSDGDFTHLAHRLRERGKVVLGLGEAKAPKIFRKACTAFVELAGVDRPTAAIPSPACSPLDVEIRSMIATHSRNGAGMRLVELAPKMHSAHGVRISQQPERTWRAYLAARPAMYDLDPRVPKRW